MMEVRTSESDPIRVDWLPPAGPGRVGATIAPGKRAGAKGGRYRWDRDLGEDLRRLRDDLQVDVLVNLLEDTEMARLGVPLLVEAAHEYGVDVVRLPIPDGGSPPSLDPMGRLVRRIDQMEREGYRVAVHCAGGLGRTGTVIGCYLAHIGYRLDDIDAALLALRGPRCPENESQRQFIRRYWGMG